MPDLVLTVTAANREYRNCVMSVKVDAGKLPAGPLSLIDDAGMLVPVQLERQTGRPNAAVLHWIVPYLAAGQTRTCRVAAVAAPEAPGVVLRRDQDRLDIVIAGQPFTSYWFGKEWAKPYLHPLLGPAGSVTRRWPMEQGTNETTDHKHHKGCYAAWGDVNGADVWSEEKDHGKAVHQDFIAVESGPVVGRVAAENHWFTHDGRKLLTEHREYRFYNLPAVARVFDMTVRFLADCGNVTFGDTKEGGLCSLRVASSMDASGAGCFVNGYGGVKENEGWGKPAPWCDYFGPVGKSVQGVAIFDHPGNLRHPTCWHVRNYGLMTANPFGRSQFENHPGKPPLGSHELPAGQELVFRYRVFIHGGDTWQARVADQYHHWVNPPTVKVAG